MPRAVSPSPRALRLAFVASLALFARVLDAARADKQSNETLDPLAGLRAHPELPRELRLPLSVASAALADAGLAPRAADAIARYGGADRAARDLALVLAAATAACGDGREEATDALASSSAAAARAGPLRALFSGLTHELELRTRVTKELDELSSARLLSAEDPYDVRDDEPSGARFVVDALDEAEASLARAGGDGGSSSCFAGAGGIVTRTLRALGILAEDLESVVTTLRQRSAEELRECGLGASALDAKENDSDDSDDVSAEIAADVETLAYFAARAETCRRRGRVERSTDLATFASVETISEMPEERKKDRLRRLSARVLASHLALADATRAEARAAEIRGDGYAKGRLRTCLGDSFAPPDPRWDAPAGASLLTSTGALAFVVAALGDVTLSESACERALDAPPGVFFASPALDAVAQEAAEAGVFPAAAAWLAASPSGSAGLEASVDEVQAAARACAINAAEKKSWIVVERGPTDAALSFLRRLEAATLGRRGGRRGYSAVGKLVRALETLVEKLESGGCIEKTSESASVEPVEPVEPIEPSKRAEESGSSAKQIQSGSVETAVPARTTSRAAADFARRDDADADAEVLADPRGFPRGSNGSNGASSTTSDLVLGVLFGVAAFALVAAAAGAVASRRGARSAARKRRASASSPRASASAGADRLDSDRSSLLGGGAAGSARRFYRHLEAGSAGDLPLVEDLDRVASLPGARSPAASGSPRSESPRASSPPSAPYASQFFAPASRRRSHSISEPAAARAQLPPRHERRHTTRAEDV